MTQQYVLAADVGGTSTRLRLSALRADGGCVTVAQRRAPSRDSDALRAEVLAFVHGIPGAIGRLRGAVIGLPGRISADRLSCAISYLDPERYVSFADLFRDLRVCRGLLMNDLECGASGVRCADASAMVPLRRGAASAVPSRRRFAIGMPGSGLGLGVYLEPVGTIPSEGGHVAAAIDPRDPDEAAVWRRAVERDAREHSQRGLPTYESLLRGRAIEDLYQALAGAARPAPLVADGEDAFRGIPSADRPLAVTRWAREPDERGALARSAMRLYGRLLGRALQCVALVLLPEAVYVGGDIVQANHDLIAPELLAAFDAHVVHAAFLRALPVVRITEPELNLCGATRRATELAPGDGVGGYERSR